MATRNLLFTDLHCGHCEVYDVTMRSLRGLFQLGTTYLGFVNVLLLLQINADLWKIEACRHYPSNPQEKLLKHVFITFFTTSINFTVNICNLSAYIYSIFGITEKLMLSRFKCYRNHHDPITMGVRVMYITQIELEPRIFGVLGTKGLTYIQ